MAKYKQETLKPMFPRVANEKCVGDYIASKMETRTTTKKFSWDRSRYDPQIDLEEARRELDEVEDRLAKRRQIAKEKRTNLDAQWRELAEKEDLFRESFVKFNNFVRGNQEKRERAMERIRDEKKVRHEREVAVQQIKMKYEEKKAIKDKFDGKLKEYQIYEQFLNRVISESDEFKSVDDLVNRYESLLLAKKELAKRQESNLTNLEMARTKIVKLIEENSFLIMGLNNNVSMLNSRYQKAVAKSMHWETVVFNIRKSVFQNLKEMGEVKRAAWNIYLLMCKRKNEKPEIDETDFENHLDFIKKTLAELKKVNKAAESVTKRHISSMKVEISKASRLS